MSMNILSTKTEQFANDYSDLKDFNSVVVKVAADVTITQGDFKVTITADEQIPEGFHAVVKSNVLEIRLEKKYQKKGIKNLKIVIRMPKIENFTGIGNNNVVFNGNFKADKIKFRIVGSDNVTINDKFVCNEAKFRFVGNDKFIAPNFSTNKAIIKAVGSGMINLKVTEKLKTRLIGCDGVTYTGSPKVRKLNIGSGSVTKAK